MTPLFAPQAPPQRESELLERLFGRAAEVPYVLEPEEAEQLVGVLLELSRLQVSERDRLDLPHLQLGEPVGGGQFLPRGHHHLIQAAVAPQLDSEAALEQALSVRRELQVGLQDSPDPVLAAGNAGVFHLYRKSKL